MAELLFILPTYGSFEYAADAARTFFEHSPADSKCLLIDDASPDYDQINWERWQEELPTDRLVLHRFAKNGGLTRSWNWGLNYARSTECQYTICGNSDILFTPNWWCGLKRHIDQGAALVGPVTNAPGRTAQGRQNVGRFLPGYKVSDDPHKLRETSVYLATRYADAPLQVDEVNGFFMVASTARWWEGAFRASGAVFDPGRRMEYNEVELQKRWRKRGWQIGYTQSSFIFHYRSVSRGDRYRSAGWYRKPAPVTSE